MLPPRRRNVRDFAALAPGRHPSITLEELIMSSPNNSAGIIFFSVPGVPVAQPRCRFTAIGPIVRAYVPAKHPVHAFKDAVSLCFRQAHRGPPLDGPVGLWARFIFPPIKTRKPKRDATNNASAEWYAAARRYDWDNLAKALCDALNGLAWHDDGQIAVAHIERIRGSSSGHTLVIIWPLGSQPPSPPPARPTTG